MSQGHYLEGAPDKLQRYVLVKQVAHRVHENALRLLPSQRDFQHVRMQRQRESVAVIRLPHRP
jgi:hypothetical protein